MLIIKVLQATESKQGEVEFCSTPGNFNKNHYILLRHLSKTCQAPREADELKILEFPLTNLLSLAFLGLQGGCGCVHTTQIGSVREVLLL